MKMILKYSLYLLFLYRKIKIIRNIELMINANITVFDWERIREDKANMAPRYLYFLVTPKTLETIKNIKISNENIPCCPGPGDRPKVLALA